MAEVLLQKPAFALPGCQQQIRENSLLRDTLELADFPTKMIGQFSESCGCNMSETILWLNTKTPLESSFCRNRPITIRQHALNPNAFRSHRQRDRHPNSSCCLSEPEDRWTILLSLRRLRGEICRASPGEDFRVFLTLPTVCLHHLTHTHLLKHCDRWENYEKPRNRLARNFGTNPTPLRLTVKPGKNTNSIRPGILFVFFGFVFVSWKEKNSGRILLVFFRLKARNTCRIRIRIFRKEFIPPENTFRSYFFSARQ